jgi:hypothetical protein
MDGIATPVGYPVQLRFTAATTPTAAEIVTASQANGRDLRIVYNNQEEIPRVVRAFRPDLVEIWFPLRADLAGGDQLSYALYYGNPNAAEPGYQPQQVFLPSLEGGTRLLLYADEGNGTTTADLSTNANHGTLTGAIGWGEGRFGPGLSLSGGYVRVENSPSLQITGSTITVEAWVRPSTIDDKTRNIVAQLVPGQEPSWRLLTRRGELLFDVTPPTGAGTGVTTIIKLEQGKWSHVAGVADGQRLRLFINGTEVASTPFSQPIRRTNAWVAVGSTGYLDEPWLGEIDQVRITSTPITLFPYGRITVDPRVEAGIERVPDTGPPIPGAGGNGAPDLRVDGINAIAYGSGRALVSVRVTNHGDLATSNDPLFSVYADHTPTGPGDLAGTVGHLAHAPIEPGQTVTMTGLLDLSALSGSMLYTALGIQERTVTLAVQADSLGTLHDSGRTDNIASAPALCVANSDGYNDDSVATAKPIVSGTTQHRNFDGPGDEDWVTFQARQGVSYSLRTANLGAQVDTILEIFKTDGATLLAANDDVDASGASELTWTAPANGTYAVRVRQLGGAGGCGTSYDLRFNAGQLVFLPRIMR